MRNGRLTGHGDYQSAFNEVMSGQFIDGVLHGDKSFYQNYCGECYLGTMEYGEPNGFGHYHNERG